MWDPGQYRRYGDERARPFFDLLARVDAADPKLVLDLGCGPGDLTATLAGRWPGADVIGVDSSAAMIESARGGAQQEQMVREWTESLRTAYPDWGRERWQRRLERKLRRRAEREARIANASLFEGYLWLLGAIVLVIVALSVWPLFWLIFPMKAKYMVMIYAALELVVSLGANSGVSAVAHLGGMAFSSRRSARTPHSSAGDGRQRERSVDGLTCAGPAGRSIERFDRL